jgi:hypothetical protein
MRLQVEYSDATQLLVSTYTSADVSETEFRVAITLDDGRHEDEEREDEQRRHYPTLNIFHDHSLKFCSDHHPECLIPAKLPRRSPKTRHNAAAQCAQTSLPRHTRRQAKTLRLPHRGYRRESRHGHDLHPRHRPKRQRRPPHD